MRRPANRLPAGAHGITSALEFAMEFRRWADAQREVTAASIYQRWGVSPATGNRWLGAYRAVREREAAST